MTIGFVGGFITSYLLLSVLSSFLFLTLLFSLLVISLTLLLQKKIVLSRGRRLGWRKNCNYFQNSRFIFPSSFSSLSIFSFPLCPLSSFFCFCILWQLFLSFFLPQPSLHSLCLFNCLDPSPGLVFFSHFSCAFFPRLSPDFSSTALCSNSRNCGGSGRSGAGSGKSRNRSTSNGSSNSRSSSISVPFVSSFHSYFLIFVIQVL